MGTATGSRRRRAIPCGVSRGTGPGEGAVSRLGETSTAMPDGDVPWGFSTTAIHGGRVPDANKSVVTPIYQTATFRYDSVDEGAGLGAESAPGYFYTRWANPTTDAFEQKVALLEGGEAALA